MPATLPRIGAILRITAVGAETGAPPWDLAIGAPNWWRAPDPRWIVFVSDGRGYVADVVDRRVVHEIPDVVRVREDELHDLVLFLGDGDMTAVGAEGVRWHSAGLALGDLKVRAIDGRGIHTTGFVTEADAWRGIPTAFVVDPADGGRVPTR